MQDHRCDGRAASHLLLSVVLFGTLSMSFFPPQNATIRAQHHPAPGSTLKQTEAVADRVAAIVQADPDVERVFERINVGNGHLNIVLKKDRKITSTEFERSLSPDACRDPGRAGQLPEPERRRTRRRLARHHALSRRRRSGASSTPSPTRSPRRWRRARASRAARRQQPRRSRKSPSSRASTLPPTSA